MSRSRRPRRRRRRCRRCPRFPRPRPCCPTAHLASSRELLAKKQKQYAPNLYEAIIKAKLYTLKAAVDVRRAAAAAARERTHACVAAPFCSPVIEATTRSISCGCHLHAAHAGRGAGGPAVQAWPADHADGALRS